MYLTTLLTTSILAVTQLPAIAYPTPITPPQQTMEQASKIALKFSRNTWETRGKPQKNLYVQHASYENFSEKSISGYMSESVRKRLTGKWGWKIQILRTNDLSQMDILFVDQTGKVVYYWSWH